LIEVQPPAGSGMDAKLQYFVRGAGWVGLSNALVNLAPPEMGRTVGVINEFRECSTQ